MAGAATTTLFTIDSGLDTLNTQAPPNDGTQNTVGDLGIDVSNVACFDFAGTGGPALLVATLAGSTTSTLFAIDLDDGSVESLGSVGASSVIVGCSIAP